MSYDAMEGGGKGGGVFKCIAMVYMHCDGTNGLCA